MSLHMFCLFWPENCAPSVDIVGFLLFLHVTTQFTTLAPRAKREITFFIPALQIRLKTDYRYLFH